MRSKRLVSEREGEKRREIERERERETERERERERETDKKKDTRSEGRVAIQSAWEGAHKSKIAKLVRQGCTRSLAQCKRHFAPRGHKICSTLLYVRAFSEAFWVARVERETLSTSATIPLPSLDTCQTPPGSRQQMSRSRDGPRKGRPRHESTRCPASKGWPTQTSMQYTMCE